MGAKFLKDTKDGALLLIYVQPKAKKNGIEGVDEWRGRLKVRIQAPPVEGKANREVVKFFSKMLGADVEIVGGETSREKTLLIRGLSAEEVRKKLGL
ncbi:hypothetical protein TEU_07805 [Thermococcus eurythermalis]|uniref:UPF0235 protein TEU_07805 n=1 Tax=Thermococcus eurythermalis TaxID=1505907 RepID=A0A097QUT9_9EURY|nr:DUF167 domain-containing protein [Thermococcus eurythermalis]AIU70245.1 hypothetical protein TEU_07805 [Thermococcus eurythermalis]